ncbi:MAG: hypothetical protein LAT75_08575 [Candidatus Cyclonatronum sp.]|uniref:hypothetical protein n=1 Tax=Cyclonatronum sp. TaxID=3024185 RepID=UPI0025C2FACD|nr:hypothetical protein [Cyclonatronum sp.]MCH8486907.1 hypothetical protein [Cyclonatronum sp.]
MFEVHHQTCYGHDGFDDVTHQSDPLCGKAEIMDDGRVSMRGKQLKIYAADTVSDLPSGTQFEIEYPALV